MRQSRIKSLVISHLFPNNFSPVYGVFVLEQLKKLSRLCELKVIVPTLASSNRKLRKTFVKNDISKKQTISGLDIAYIKAYRIIGLMRFAHLLTTLRIYLFTKRELSDFRYDLIHAHFIYPIGAIAVILSKIVKKPVVLTVHGSDINVFPHKSRLNNLSVKWVLSQAAKIIVVSNALKKRTIQFGVDDRKIVVIPNGFDCALFKPQNKDETRNKVTLSRDRRYFLFVGNLVKIKNIHFLIKAFSEVVKEIKDISLILVGDGNESARLKQLTENLGIKNRVLFVGQKEHSEIPLWINACDVLCLSSDNEGWPTVVCEALACGKPVISTNVGGVPEILSSTDLGILVQKGDLNGYVKAMEESLRKRWDSSKITSYAQEYTWEKIAQALHREYSSVVGRH